MAETSTASAPTPTPAGPPPRPRTVTITAPNGSTATLTIPEGASDEQVNAAVQSVVARFGSGAPAAGGQAPSPAAPAGSTAADELAPGAPPPGTVPTRTISRTGGGGIVRQPVEVTPPGTTDALRATPQSEVATEAAIRGAGVVGSALAFIPALEGGGLLMTGVRAAAAVLGGVGLREAAIRMLRPTGQPYAGERAEEAISDALPVLAHGVLSKVILTPAELRAFADEAPALTKPIPEPMPTRPALETPVKPGRAPIAPKPAGVPEVAPGVSAGAMSPLPVEPTRASVGPRWTRVTAEALDATEKANAALYDRSVAKSGELGLSERLPTHIVDAARDSLEWLNASGLGDAESKTAATKVLRAIRDVQGEVGEGGELVTRGGKEPVTDVTYADLDNWRRELQRVAPSFDRVGTSQTPEKGSVSHVIGLVKDEMKKLAVGTEVETLHRAAEDHFINEVRPMQRLTRMVFRGETEPNALVDALTSKAHQHKFVRWMGMLDSDAPGLAQRVRTTKLQNMLERSTEDGTFRPERFLKELDAMPEQTRRALLAGGETNDIAEFVNNVQGAQGTARLGQADAQQALDDAHARAVAAHQAAMNDYQGAAARNQFLREQYVREVEATKVRNLAAERQYQDALAASDAELRVARKKAARQAMVAGLPPAGLAFYNAASAAMAGDAWPFVRSLGGLGGDAMLAWTLSRPGTVKATNLLFRAVASGGSPKLMSRAGAQLVSHLLVSYGHAVLAPAESHPNLPPTHAQADAAALERFTSAVPARLE